MKILTSITGREFRVTSNKKKRTFTIRVDGIKYRTTPMSKEDFVSCEHNTGNDWANFLKTGEYYRIYNRL